MGTLGADYRRGPLRRSHSGPKGWKKAAIVIVLIMTISVLVCAIWLVSRIVSVRDDLQAAAQDVQLISENGSVKHLDKVSLQLESASDRIENAKEDTSDPIWKLSAKLPFLGPNISAITEVVISTDDLFERGALPMIRAIEDADLASLTPKDGSIDLAVIESLRPSINSAAETVKRSYDRLMGIDTSPLVPQLAEPLALARSQLEDARIIMDSVAAAGELIPAMAGGGDPRSYLLLIQNSAETRATGGIPGALALIETDHGRLTLGIQDSAAGLGTFMPALKVDQEQRDIYTARLGTHMQNVNLTPDFPSAAATARDMWEQRHPDHPIDGVIALDTIVLKHLLEATGPVELMDPQVLGLIRDTALPMSLTPDNVVPTLLSDVYREIEEPAVQDSYFAAVAESVFDAFANGQGESSRLMQALSTSVKERRLYLWSSHADEQSVVETTALAGSVESELSEGATFGVYFNDGTGAKMDYYAKRTVQLRQMCAVDGNTQYMVRITATNMAPADAGATLPAYVTGGGIYGVDPGRIRTNYVIYGPSGAFVEAAAVDSQPVPVSTGRHGKRPVGTVSLDLAPGETQKVDMIFSTVVQDFEPLFRVTPTIQPLEDVVLPLVRETCE